MPTTQMDNGFPPDAIRVLSVDPSVPNRSAVRKTLSSERDIAIVASAGVYDQLMDQVRVYRPDVVLLSIEPETTAALDAIQKLRAVNATTSVIACGSLENGSQAVQTALKLGANSYFSRPTSNSEDAALKNLVTMIRSIHPEKRRVGDTQDVSSRTNRSANALRSLGGQLSKSSATKNTSNQATKEIPAGFRPEVIVIGSSTGGPDALAQIVSKLERSFDKPILIAQHMPATFTEQLAQRLSSHGCLSAVQATHGMTLEIGKIYIAPGDYHMEIERAGLQIKTILHQGPKVNSCRPAVDVLFRSAAATCGKNLLAIVLTGMGRDGEDGCALVKRAGGAVWIQDRASSVIWGMPGAVAAAGLADQEFALDEIPDRLNSLVRRPNRTGSNAS